VFRVEVAGDTVPQMLRKLGNDQRIPTFCNSLVQRLDRGDQLLHVVDGHSNLHVAVPTTTTRHTARDTITASKSIETIFPSSILIGSLLEAGGTQSFLAQFAVAVLIAPVGDGVLIPALFALYVGGAVGGEGDHKVSLHR
jgi:hypothetical protein